MDIQKQTKNVAAQGRFGDSMLLHVNPAEVKGLAGAMPLTINPQTGQPEAFLPFLAPLLGSMFAPTAFAAMGLGSGLSAAAMAGIGAGVGTYIESGGSGTKALLSGLTAGMGTKALNTGAEAAIGNAASDAAIQSATTTGGQTAASLATAGETASQAAIRTAQEGSKLGVNAAGNFRGFTPGEALSNTFSGGFDQGAQALATGMMSPSGMVAGAGLGTQGIMQSQEEYERQLIQMGLDEEERKKRMYERYPEQIPMAEGGRTGYRRGGNFNNNNFGRFQNSYDNFSGMFDGGGGGGFGPRSSGGYGGYNSGAYGPPIARRTNPIPGGYMAGFGPEFSYFQNVNPTATDIQGGNPDATPNFQQQGGNAYRPQLTPPPPQFGGYGNRFMQRPSYQSFYGNPQMGGMINPYAAFRQAPIQPYTPRPPSETPPPGDTPPPDGPPIDGPPPGDTPPPIEGPPDGPPMTPPPYKIPGIGNFKGNPSNGNPGANLPPTTPAPPTAGTPPVAGTPPTAGGPPTTGTPPPTAGGPPPGTGRPPPDYYEDDDFFDRPGTEPVTTPAPPSAPPSTPTPPPIATPPPFEYGPGDGFTPPVYGGIYNPTPPPQTGGPVEPPPMITIPIEGGADVTIPDFSKIPGYGGTPAPGPVAPPVAPPVVSTPPVFEDEENEEEIGRPAPVAPPASVAPPVVEPVVPTPPVAPPVLAPEPVVSAPVAPAPIAPPVQPPIKGRPTMPPSIGGPGSGPGDDITSIGQPLSNEIGPIGGNDEIDPNVSVGSGFFNDPRIPGMINENPVPFDPNTPVDISNIRSGVLDPGKPIPIMGPPIQPKPVGPTMGGISPQPINSIQQLQPPQVGGGFMPQPAPPSAQPVPSIGFTPPAPTVGTGNNSIIDRPPSQATFTPPAPNAGYGTPSNPINLNVPSKFGGPLFAEGGDTDLPNEGLKALAQTEKGKKAVEAMGYQEGGQTDMMQVINDPITQQLSAFLLGTSDDSNIIDQFINKYGPELFEQIRNMVLSQASGNPNVQTQGQIQGNGNSGMADDIPGVIGDQEQIAVSQDEFIVPADVVSMLGDGSSDAGSKQLYNMMDRVRQAKTGGTTQASPINPNKVMPA